MNISGCIASRSSSSGGSSTTNLIITSISIILTANASTSI